MKYFKNVTILLSLILLAGCSTSGGVSNSSSFQATQQALSQQLLTGPVKTCLDEKDSGKAFICFEDYLKARVEAGGPELAFQDLKVLYDQNANVKNYCHPLAHSIGHAAVDKYSTVSAAFDHGDNFCWSGFYHGVMEEYSQKIGRKNLASKMDEICADIPGKDTYSFHYYNCVHGMGHGVMAVTNDQLFESLKLCDSLSGAWEKSSCYGGVYMENVIVDNLNHHTDFLKPEDPLYPCNAVDQKYKQQCYLMQTSYMLKLNGYDFKKVFALCEKADKGFNDTCYQSLGRDASGSTISDTAKTKTNCFLGKDYEQRSNCVIGAVKDFVSYYHSDVQAKQFCQLLSADSVDTTKMTENQRMTDLCLQTEKDYYKNF